MKEILEKLNKCIQINKGFIKEKEISDERYNYLLGRVEAYEHIKEYIENDIEIKEIFE